MTGRTRRTTPNTPTASVTAIFLTVREYWPVFRNILCFVEQRTKHARSLAVGRRGSESLHFRGIGADCFFNADVILLALRDAPSSYVTVMAFPSSINCRGEILNHFSNPAVSKMDKPTGDPTHNNARIIRENMVNILRSTTHVSHLDVA